MSIKPEDLKLKDVHNTIRAVQKWKAELTSMNVTPESIAAIYDADYAELKGTLAEKSVFTNEGIEDYFKHLLDQTYDGTVGVIFNSFAPNHGYTGCAGSYTFDFINQEQERVKLLATFEFKANKDGDGLTYHHSYRAAETPEALADQLSDDYQTFEDDEPDALDSIDLG